MEEKSNRGTPEDGCALTNAYLVMKPKGKMRHCCYCGEELGVYVDHDKFETCGKQECERFAREEARAERWEAHEKLDRDMGWR